MTVRQAGSNTDMSKQSKAVTFASIRPTDKQILVKVAISSVSIEGARKNLAAELPGWDFDKVRADAKAAWNKELRRSRSRAGPMPDDDVLHGAVSHDDPAEYL